VTTTEPQLISKDAATAYPINEVIQRRWSPRAFSARLIAASLQGSLFEAARWAPSAGNGQPWSFIVADKATDPEGFAVALGTLAEGNQIWAQHAPLLVFGVTQRIRDNGKEHGLALYDLGMAVQNLVLQATDLGLVVHQMAGFDANKAREVFAVPTEHSVAVAIAIGYQDHHADLPEPLQERELAPRQRKPLESFVFGTRFGEMYTQA
jgi:nitroreductase